MRKKDYCLNGRKENSTLNGSPSVGCWPQGEESLPRRKMHKWTNTCFSIIAPSLKVGDAGDFVEILS